MAKGSVKISGIEALRREMQGFPEAVQLRAITTGLRQAGAALRTRMRREAYSGPPKTPAGFTKTLRQALRSSVGKAKGPKAGKAWIGLKKIKGESRARNYYRVLETGRKPYTKKTGVHFRGTPNPMRPFFQRAWNASRNEVAQILIDRTRVAIAREAGRSYAKTKAGR